jgi:NOL1/NOP2/fmu family ribosome biogenesis protein
LKFLRKEIFEIESNVQGWAIVTFKHIPLGFIKINGSRVNNYYAVNWRLRKTIESDLFWCISG